MKRPSVPPETVVHVSWAVEWWDALKEMQEFASTYCARRFPGELGDRARLASNELLENAVRYATPGSEVVYEVLDLRGGFGVRVVNDAVASRIPWLRRRIEELAAPDSQSAYRSAVRRLVETGDRGLGGGLGLVRVRHEAAVELAIDISGSRVAVTATGQAGNYASRGVPSSARRTKT
jgi:hypothetical protein